MFFSNYTEFTVILLFTLFYNVIKWVFPSVKKLQSIVLLIGSYLILLLIVDLNTLFILSVLMFAVYGSAKVLLSANLSQSGRRKILTSVLLGIILLFCIRNYTWFAEFFSLIGLDQTVSHLSLVGRIGLSYILFRLLHFLIDAYRQKIHQLNFLTFLNYIFFFPTYLSGPIDRYQNFSFWLNNHKKVVSLNMMYQGIGRLFLGAAKKFLIVPLILPFVNDLSAFDFASSLWQVQILLSALAYAFYIYFDFSGYSDIAIGSAYLLGVRTPENFNNPYLSKDIAEFWKKWHMSFSSILTEYVFKPFVIGLSKRLPNWPRISVSIIGYLYTFIICGLWHGTTMNYVYWGFWHGAGLAVFKIWEKYEPSTMKKFKGMPRNITALTLNFAFVTVGWFFFMSSTAKVHNVLEDVFPLINRNYSHPDEEMLTLETRYWDGYGWGIKLKYPADPASTFEVDLKKIESYAWTRVVEKRDGKYDFVDVHGDVIHGTDKRNLDPGTYVVRIKKTSDEFWLGGIVTIKDFKVDE